MDRPGMSAPKVGASRGNGAGQPIRPVDLHAEPLAETPDERTAIERVIDGGYCVGCGACAFAEPEAFSMQWTGLGALAARVDARSPEALRRASPLCPMSGEGANEDEIAARLFPALPRFDDVGRVSSVVAAHRQDETDRLASSSGGILTYVSARLLERGLVDAVMHVVPAAGREGLFEFSLSRTVDELNGGRKSRYYPVEMSGVLKQIRQFDGQVAIMGVPCFIKAVRKLADHDPELGSRIRYCLGLICGHLKTRFFAEFLAWQKGIAPGDLGAIDFRDKIAGRSASAYGFRAATRDGEIAASPMAAVAGGDWGEGMFKLKACDFCDDVVAECADIAVGDAWLDSFTGDYRGTSVVCFRDSEIERLVRDGASSGDLAMSELTVEELVRSQSAGIRHRTEGLAHRLHKRAQTGEWAPRKRIEPGEAPPPRARIYELREDLREESNRHFSAAKRQGELAHFFRQIGPLRRAYRQAYLPPKHKRVLGRLKRMGRKLLRR